MNESRTESTSDPEQICITPDKEILYADSSATLHDQNAFRTADVVCNSIDSENHDHTEYHNRVECSGADQSRPTSATPQEPPRRVVMAPQRPPGRVAPITLFVLTCFTTLAAGTPETIWEAIIFFLTHGRLPHGTPSSDILQGLFMGFQYAGPLMLILFCHEMGHYIQARRNRIPASLPYFIPMPTILGTMGAVIGMRANLGDRRSLFDVGITGPLAGLVPTIIFLIVGLHFSEIGPIQFDKIRFGEPLLMQWVIHFQFGTVPAGQDVLFHPMAFAAWVGLLITSLNLLPIGQLDGGHVLHALMPRGAKYVATFVLWGAIAASFYFEYTIWALMILLLLMMGPKHPPTADDKTPIGPLRVVLGWLTLAFIFVGFTPMPIKLL